MSFMARIAHQDSSIVAYTRTARLEVSRQATALASLETRDRKLAEQILGQRNQIAALQSALLRQQIAQLRSRAGKSNELGGLSSHLKKLQAQAAKQEAQADRKSTRLNSSHLG